jgi:hypothetical protein
MVLLACAPGVVLVAADVVVEVDVDVDVLVSVLVPEPQPTSVRLSATVAIIAVRSFMYCISRNLGPRYLRR